jgi:hypothetical protein
MRFGTYDTSCHNLPCMLCKICEGNTGSYFDVVHFPNPMGGLSILQMVYLCLSACVMAFQFYSGNLY